MRNKVKDKFHAPVARAYASSARSSSSEYLIRGASKEMGPSACATTSAALPGANAGCSMWGSPRKCGIRRATSLPNLYPHVRILTSATLRRNLGVSTSDTSGKSCLRFEVAGYKIEWRRGVVAIGDVHVTARERVFLGRVRRQESGMSMKEPSYSPLRRLV